MACPFHNSLTFELIGYNGAVGRVADYRRFPNKRLRWLYFTARIAVNVALDSWIVGAGYGVSDLDYYSSRRHVTLPGGKRFHVPDRQLSQSIFLSLAYDF